MLPQTSVTGLTLRDPPCFLRNRPVFEPGGVSIYVVTITGVYRHHTNERKVPTSPSEFVTITLICCLTSLRAMGIPILLKSWLPLTGLRYICQLQKSASVLDYSSRKPDFVTNVFSWRYLYLIQPWNAYKSQPG
jgi:hypothetical protein